ncbi:MAG: hypothetical protein ABS939_06800 [Psychrobacillus sp.]
MRHSFKHVNGRIILVTSIGETDVTDDIMPVVDDYLDYHLELDDYKRIDGKIVYTGKDKGRYF